MLSDGFLSRLNAFTLSLGRDPKGGLSGMRRAKAQGSSVEFADFREYAPGDDLRLVDWNAYARFDRLFLKLFLDEQETTLRLLIDSSASMATPDGEKWQQTLNLCAMLSYISLCRYDRVVIHPLHGAGWEKSRTFSGLPSFPQVEGYLSAIVPGGETHLNEALLRLPLSSGRGVCVLLSDLLTSEGFEKGAASLLYRRQEVALLHILSPKELAPDFTGALRLMDGEGGPSRDVQIGPEALRRYDKALQAFLKEQRHFCHRHQMAYALIRSDMSLERDVLDALMKGGLLAAR